MASFYIEFDSPVLLKKRIYYFQYRSILFKLISGTKEYQHCLVSVTSEYDQDWQNILDVGLEFLSILSWEWGLPVILSTTAGSGHEDDLKKIRRYITDSRNLRPSQLCDLPLEIFTPRDKKEKKILSIYREARTASPILPAYSFLSFWRILQITNGSTGEPVDLAFDIIGSDFFREKFNINSSVAAKNFLKDEHKDAMSHAFRGTRKIPIMDNSNDLKSMRILSSELGFKTTRLLRTKFGFRSNQYLDTREATHRYLDMPTYCLVSH